MVPPGRSADAKKWARRNQPLAAVLAAGVVLLAVGLATALVLRGQAVDNLALAKKKEQEAREQEQIATARADDVLRLSAMPELEDMGAEADALWPPHPENIAAYRAWIARAEKLVADLPRHRADRKELRALALPRTEEQRAAERASQPEFGRIAALTGELEAKRRALAQRRDGTAAPLPDVDWGAYPAGASALNNVAWDLIDPERKPSGKEPLALVLALRALELAGEDAELAPIVGDTVAWAYASLGRDAEAAAASRAALEAAAEPRKPEYAGYLAKFESQGAAARSAEGLRAAEAEIEQLEAELSSVEARVDERREWRFPDEHEQTRWWHAQLTKLIERLEGFRAGLLEPGALTAEHGWSIGKRLAFAEDLASDFTPGGRYTVAWERDLPAIRAAYPGLELTPQMGLLPIGADPASGLWEFAHLLTGAPAERGPDGRLVLTEEAGVVLVLIPSGRFFMGAQSADPSGRNYDAQAAGDEGPVHEVALSAHLLSKHEMTQGQWERITGRNPSYYGPWHYSRTRNAQGAGWSSLYPVEEVSWSDCMTWLPRVGLALPSEAQWEHGCRAGTASVYWSGDEKEALQGVANLSDDYAKKHGNQSWTVWEPWLDDGNTGTAVVGSYRPNALGLHDVHGNLDEWCLDGYDSGFYGRGSPEDPVAPIRGSAPRVIRGGGFTEAASFARSADRGYLTPEIRGDYLGVRPARGITP